MQKSPQEVSAEASTKAAFDRLKAAFDEFTAAYSADETAEKAPEDMTNEEISAALPPSKSGL